MMKSRDDLFFACVRVALGLVMAALAVMEAASSESMAAFGTEKTARLKECLTEDHMYLAKTVDILDKELNSDKILFKEHYHNRYIALSGQVISVSSDYKEVMIGGSNGNSRKLDTSGKEVKDAVSRISVQSNITAYGVLMVKGVGGDSYEIRVESITSGTGAGIVPDTYVFSGGEVFSGKSVSLPASGGRTIKYNIPQSWDDDLICSKLTNNEVKGYQYYLNAVEPRNADYPELFCIFYFINEEHLKNAQKKPSDGFNKKTEELIVRNILQGIDINTKVKIETIKNSNINRTKMDYHSITYSPKDDNDYRLEFIFLPDQKGITCTLYLYYPKDEAVNHTRDVAYLIETMTMQ